MNEQKCHCCGGEKPYFICETCEGQKCFCRNCYEVFHRRSERRDHLRKVNRICLLEEEIEDLCNQLASVSSKDQTRQEKIEKLEKSQDEFTRTLTEIESINREVISQLKKAENEKNCFLVTISDYEAEIGMHEAKEALLKQENEEQRIRIFHLENEISALKTKTKEETIPVFTRTVDVSVCVPVERRNGVWKKCCDGAVSNGAVPVSGSGDSYVARIYIGGDIVPGQVATADKLCSVRHSGMIKQAANYEVLVGASSFKWIQCHGDQIPANAICGGITKNGENLYIGRVDYYGWIAGKVQPTTKGCSPPIVGGGTKVYLDYEILVWKN